MTVQIDLHQERTLVDGKYRVDTRVTYASGIGSEIFVYDTELDVFVHVATVWDMVNTGTDRALAQVDRQPYYRKAYATVDYDDQVRALAFAAYTKERVQLLALLHDQLNTEFLGEEDVTYTEPTDE